MKKIIFLLMVISISAFLTANEYFVLAEMFSLVN